MAQRIILGKLDFADLPDVLKADTYAVLEESGLEFMAGDYKPQ